MGGARFAGKIAAELAGISVLEHVVRRARHRGYTVVIASPSSDAPQLAWASSFRQAVPDRTGAPKLVPFYFADCNENHVLSRVYYTARWANDMDRFTNGGDGYQCIVRLTADCPFVPVEAIDAVSSAVTEGNHDYCETRSDPSSRPNGIDAQAFTYELLREAALSTSSAEEEQHITPALLRVSQRPGRVQVLEALQLDEIPGFRMTVDTKEDLARMNRWAEFVPVDPTAGRPTLVELKDLHRRHPELFKMVENGK